MSDTVVDSGIVTVSRTFDFPPIPDGFEPGDIEAFRCWNEAHLNFTTTTAAANYILDHWGWLASRIVVNFSSDTQYGWHELACLSGVVKTVIHQYEE